MINGTELRKPDVIINERNSTQSTIMNKKMNNSIEQ